MLDQARQSARFVRPRAAALLAGATLALTAASIAAARPDRGGGPARGLLGVGHGGGGAAHGGGGRDPQPPAAPPVQQPAQAAPVPAAGGAHGGDAGRHGRSGGGVGAGAGKGRGKEAGSAAPGQSNNSAPGRSGKGRRAQTAAGVSVGATVEAGHGHGGRASAEAGGQVGAGGAKVAVQATHSPSQAGTPAPASGGAPTLAPQPSGAGASAPTLPAASPISTPAPSAGSTSARARARARRTRAASRRRAAARPRRRPAAAGAPTAATLPTALTATPLAAAGAAGAAARAGTGGDPRRAQPSAQPPIVQTITKIVGVIPLAVWIAGAALLALALALAAGSRLLALRARRLERQRGELLADVGLLQSALLPAPPAGPGPLSTSVAYRPADGPAAGGDFYDVFGLEDGRLATIVGDVSGHGRQALPHTALVRFTLRAYLEAGLSPREALRTAGAVLERQLDGALVSAVLATYQPRERTLVYACAGHPSPIVLGANNALAPLNACAAPPIGTGMPTGTRQTVVSLPGAAQVCLHTDGVTDARAGSELYGSRRLAATLAELGERATAAALLERVAEETDARPDDMAACLLTLRGEPLEPTTQVQELELWRDQSARERAERFLLACGLDLRESAALAGTACAQAERAGSALIEARPAAPGAGPASARVHRDDLPDIHASDTRRLATVGGAR
jgi:stage II sporulation SpoE-like protein